ncbi:hypothetical protein RZO55_21030 [Clostridium boliviensis]|uniref:Phage holin family protein n=1 Tax=Clostridium boliviensis TaxID=318465 RepID=A0ABU4GSU3_9CLOT|nr:hypothetical protein [Clostridium boliviensis]MDW2800062.1 hypothetical protein [Clostridium boliviensis]
MIFNKDEENNLIINFKINNSLKLLLLFFFKTLILCALVVGIINLAAYDMRWFLGIFIIIILTALTSILSVKFFQKCIHHYVLFPLLINLVIGIVFWNQIKAVNGIELFINGCIYAICNITVNFIISVLAVKFYVKKRGMK